MTPFKKFAILAIAVAVVHSPLHAADTDFFKDKQITYIVATNAGGGHDAYGRLIGKYMEQHLEADNVLINNLPGAGHIIGTNTLWEAKPNGLTIGTFDTALIYSQILGRDSLELSLSRQTATSRPLTT